MITYGKCYRTPSGLVVCPVVDSALHHVNVYIPFGVSTQEQIEVTVQHALAARRGPPPREDFSRGS